jgi:hypothetical protein
METTRPRQLAILGLALIAVIAVWRQYESSLPHLGATVTVTELTSGLSLKTRVDTGAEICSLHYEQLEIPSPDADPEMNVGKLARFQIKGMRGQTAWLESRLVKHAQVRNSSHTASRYFVELPLRVEGFEATVLVNLNDRTSMRRPMLLGRNFLRGRFAVDVSRNDTDFAPD